MPASVGLLKYVYTLDFSDFSKNVSKEGTRTSRYKYPCNSL